MTQLNPQYADQMQALRAKLKKAGGMGGWQPIETAPDNGRLFLAWSFDHVNPILHCRINQGKFQYRHSHAWFDLRAGLRVNYWMPMPDLPTPEAIAITHEMDALKQAERKRKEESE